MDANRPQNIEGLEGVQSDPDRLVYYRYISENKRIVYDLSGRLIDVEDYK